MTASKVSTKFIFMVSKSIFLISRKVVVYSIQLYVKKMSVNLNKPDRLYVL